MYLYTSSLRKDWLGLKPTASSYLLTLSFLEVRTEKKAIHSELSFLVTPFAIHLKIVVQDGRNRHRIESKAFSLRSNVAIPRFQLQECSRFSAIATRKDCYALSFISYTRQLLLTVTWLLLAISRKGVNKCRSRVSLRKPNWASSSVRYLESLFPSNIEVAHWRTPILLFRKTKAKNVGHDAGVPLNKNPVYSV